MKITMNFTLSDDDIGRYTDSANLRQFYQEHHLSGLEVMPLEPDDHHLLTPDMVIGMHAEYVVFHITQVSYAESPDSIQSSV